jgi:hypothetical protein
MIPVAVDGLPEGWPQDHGVITAGPQVLAWGECTLSQPDGAHAGQRWAWTVSQARFVAWWYAMDAAGRFLWRRAQVVLPKGAGKSPMMAALACVELAGPVVFKGFDADGAPVMTAHPSPDTKLSALSLSQAVDATLGLANAMLDNPTAGREIPGLDVGLTRIRTTRGMLSPATAKAPSKEGPRYTAVIWMRRTCGIEATVGTGWLRCCAGTWARWTAGPSRPRTCGCRVTGPSRRLLPPTPTRWLQGRMWATGCCAGIRSATVRTWAMRRL